jgi:hypothetical protein
MYMLEVNPGYLIRFQAAMAISEIKKLHNDGP